MVPKIKLLAGSDEFEPYAAGQIIFQGGDPGECMYCVKSGLVEIVAGGRVLETFEAGHVFGEMALVDNQPRSATAIVRSSCSGPLTTNRFSPASRTRAAQCAVCSYSTA